MLRKNHGFDGTNKIGQSTKNYPKNQRNQNKIPKMGRKENKENKST